MAPDSILSEWLRMQKLSGISDTSDYKLDRHFPFVINECLSWHNFSLLLYYPSFSKIMHIIHLIEDRFSKEKWFSNAGTHTNCGSVERLLQGLVGNLNR